MQTQSLAHDFTFGRFRVGPSRRSLSVDGEPVKVGARAFDVLMALVERRDRIVSKNELLEVVWPTLVVEENNLQVQIWALRKLFGPEVIATVPGRGYRFTAALDDGQDAEATTPASAGSAVAVPPPRPPTNLSAEPQPLYGREDDLEAVCRLVAAWRLVTVVGAGGIGKTRVGEAVAHSLRDRYPDGVWLVELAPLADPALLPGSSAQTLGLQLRGQRPLLDELVAALAPQQLLLVLDNCEHLLGAAILIAQALLSKTAHVRLLVTSQEPLRLSGEHLFRLGTLAVPKDTATALSASLAIGYSAVRLFVERVQALDPRFQLDDRNAAAVTDICRQLDGLALAIEFAAARVPSLGVQGVRERLGERLRMLTAGARSAARRHHTLRAALDWSHGLLEASEQAVFRRLAVFSGGFTAEAAQQVAADEQLDDWAVLDSVSLLIDKSLVVAGAEERPRYYLLESARAYALEKLGAAEETQALARRHAEHFAARFKHFADALFDGELSEDGFIAARGLELDNLRAAMAWALGTGGNTDTALELLVHTAPVALLMPSYGECGHWASALERRIGEAAQSPRRAALHAYAQAHWGVQQLRLSGHPSASPGMTVAALRGLDDPRRQAHALCMLAIHAEWRGNHAAARSALEEADRLGTAGWRGWLWSVRVDVSIRVGQMSGEQANGAAAAIEDVLERLRREGEGAGRGAFVMRTKLADDSLLQGRLEEAAQRFQALAELGRRQRRDVYRICMVLAPLALALVELDRLDAAREAVLEALPPLQHTGMRSDFAPILALVAARRGLADVAARLLGAGDAFLARAGGCRPLIARLAERRLRALLAASHPGPQVDGWIHEGQALNEEEFARLVVKEG